ncbi:MAG: IS200/IS605 family transposase [Methanobrevibacter sp.]|jgi:hypothetical protein|nr:IS200/IS605 family transposase [Candidatus Methanovirga basalitermitum]
MIRHLDINLEIQDMEHDYDHIHICFSSKPDCNLEKFAIHYNTMSSRIIKEEYSEVKEQLWKNAFWKIGYFITSTRGVTIGYHQTIYRKSKKQIKEFNFISILIKKLKIILVFVLDMIDSLEYNIFSREMVQESNIFG